MWFKRILFSRLYLATTNWKSAWQMSYSSFPLFCVIYIFLWSTDANNLTIKVVHFNAAMHTCTCHWSVKLNSNEWITIASATTRVKSTTVTNYTRVLYRMTFRLQLYISQTTRVSFSGKVKDLSCLSANTKLDSNKHQSR